MRYPSIVRRLLAPPVRPPASVCTSRGAAACRYATRRHVNAVTAAPGFPLPVAVVPVHCAFLFVPSRLPFLPFCLPFLPFRLPFLPAYLSDQSPCSRCCAPFSLLTADSVLGRAYHTSLLPCLPRATPSDLSQPHRQHRCPSAHGAAAAWATGIVSRRCHTLHPQHDASPRCGRAGRTAHSDRGPNAAVLSRAAR
eukprot:364583-Chlamydomonas_euryale.AAC.4